MEYVVDAIHCGINGAAIANVADIEFHFWILECMAHVVLFFFVAREYAYFFDVGIEETT